jgi:hypothetical protein
MGSWTLEWLFAATWIFVGDPAAGEIRAWSGRSSAAPRVLGEITELRALAVDRARGLWFAHGSHGVSIARARLAAAPLAPRVVALQRATLDRPIRALAAGAGSACVALLEDESLVRARAAEAGLAIEERAAWPPIAALASDAHGELLTACGDGSLHRLDAGHLAFASAQRVAPPGPPIEAVGWCAVREAWLVVESGGGTLRCLDREGAERLRVALPFPAIAATGTRSRLWIASANENFVASIDLGAAVPHWRPEEVPPGDLRAIFAHGSRVAAVGSTRWSWRARGAWLARAGGPGLLAVEALR